MKQKIFENITCALNTAEIPIKFQKECIDDMLSQKGYDMRLYMDIMEHGASFFIKERGNLILNYYFDNAVLIEYIVIREVLEKNFSIKRREYHDPKTTYTEAANQYMRSAFEKIGEPYLNYYNKKVTIWNVDGK